MTKQKIMYESPEAAEYKTVEGWVANSGQFWGKDEAMARYCGSTHRICDTCGAERETRGYCRPCASLRETERYNALPFQEWDGTTPLCIYGDDTYFFEEDDIVSYVESNDIPYDELQLEICQPNVAHEIEADDIYCDILAEDRTVEDTDSTLAGLIEAVNKHIRENQPIFSWSGANIRTTYSGPKAETGAE